MKTLTLTKGVVPIAMASAMFFAANSVAFEAKLSGQVSRMMVLPDDAAGDEIQHVDIGWSGSRFRFIASETAENGITYGARFEIQARENSAGAHNGGTLGDSGDNQDNRYQDLYISGDFGKVSFGKGDGAANGGAEVDLSGTALASNAAGITDNYGGYQVAPGVSFSSVFEITDALSRQNRVRYDTPGFNGFSIAGSLNQGNSSELALRYKGGWDGMKFGAAVFTATAADVAAVAAVPATVLIDSNGDTVTTDPGSAARPAQDGDDITGFSASLLLDSGLNFTVASTRRDDGANDPAGDKEGTFFKLGYKTGMHALTVDLGDSEVGALEGETTGFTYAYFPHKGVEMFATIRTLDSTNVANSQSVDITAVGGRIKF